MPKSTSKASAEDRLQYILTVLSYTNLEQPDYQAITKATGQSSANNAQKKFKACIEQANFKLVNRQVVPKDNAEDSEDDETTNKSPQPGPPKAKRTTASGRVTKPILKKTVAKAVPRQTTTDVDGANNDDDGEGEGGSEGPRNVKKRTADEIIELSSDEEEGVDNNDLGNNVNNLMVKLENQVEQGLQDNEGEHTEDEDEGTEAERLRRSRARSRTVKPEVVV